MSDGQANAQDLAAQALTEAQSQVNNLQGEVSALAGVDPVTDAGIDMLGDVELNVTVELGRTEMPGRGRAPPGQRQRGRAR